MPKILHIKFFMFIFCFIVIYFTVPPSISATESTTHHNNPYYSTSFPPLETPPNVDNDLTSEENRPCAPNEDNRSSDLCAQWKSADAASDAAYWTWASFITACAGSGIGFMTLIAASVAAFYARDAAKHTEAGANHAAEGNNISREVVETQLRAWVAFTDWEVSALGQPDNIIGIVFNMKWKNLGQTPALNAACQTYRDGQIVSDRDKKIKGGSIGPSVQFEGMPQQFTLDEIIASANNPIVVFGHVEYDTIFPNIKDRHSNVSASIKYIGQQGKKDINKGMISPNNFLVLVFGDSSQNNMN